jgi:hypothetical protein
VDENGGGENTKTGCVSGKDGSPQQHLEPADLYDIHRRSDVQDRVNYEPVALYQPYNIPSAINAGQCKTPMESVRQPGEERDPVPWEERQMRPVCFEYPPLVRHGENRVPAVPKYAAHLRQGCTLVGDMLEHLEAHDNINRMVGKRKMNPVILYRENAPDAGSLQLMLQHVQVLEIDVDADDPARH